MGGFITRKTLESIQKQHFIDFCGAKDTVEIAGVSYSKLQILSVQEILDGERFKTPLVRSTIVWTVFWISLRVVGFNIRETRTAIKCLSGYTFRPAEALTPEGAVYTDSVALGLCFLRDAIPFSASSRVWETQRKITEYSGCASVFVNTSMRWRHRLTVYATAEGSQRRHLPISKIVQTIVRSRVSNDQLKLDLENE